MTNTDFESITESGPLVRELRDRIARGGPMTFRDFMEAALYHPRYGYYSTTAGATRRGGDFVTSPDVHPIFGTLVAKTLLELWETMARPKRFDVVEQGAGSGLLARDILRWAHEREPSFATALGYTLVERSAAMRDAQERATAELDLPPGTVSWADELPLGIEGVVLSNELVDAFPIHRVVRRGAELHEVYVKRDGDRFVDELGPLSTPALWSYFDALGVMPGDGHYAEVNLDAIEWMRTVTRSLSRGYTLTFDYGYEAADLYASFRRDGTLLCFYKQSAGSDPYQRIGKQDMTASVDFTTLKRTAEDAGLATIAMADQSDFLVRLGIAESLVEVQDQMEEYFARRRIVMDLIDPALLGRIKVLLQGKDVGKGALPLGFRE
ncbi:MAG: SAM-dependent methyltransferase [Chloroflexi bacterium]|nr:SAM-dependent methyltransferase [Chloroflexota bacterium]